MLSIVMDADECTEDQCIATHSRVITGMNTSLCLKYCNQEDFQQMKITRVDTDGNRDVRTTYHVKIVIFRNTNSTSG